MKKLIVLLILLSATICYADMKDDLFKMTSTIDVTVLKENPGNKIYGLTKSSKTEFFTSMKEFCVSKDSVVLRAGAGIVYDSVPEKEYREVKIKLGALFDSLQQLSTLEKKNVFNDR